MNDSAFLETSRPMWRCLLAALAALVVGASSVVAGTAPALARPEPGATALAALSAPRGAASCLDCHGNRDLSTPLPSGERVSLFVDEVEMAKSVHGGKLGCTDCHSRINSFPHRRVAVSSRREYSLALYEACKRCHFTNYTKTLDSIHYKVMESGNQESPLCTDCHGYHNVRTPDEPRSSISLSCARCHTVTYDTYVRSVHGAALIRDENGDVPVCTDCHGTHTIRNATSAAFRLDSPEMCGRCHADETLMRKYDLSPKVFKTYLQDFHGTTVTLARRQGPGNWTDKAVCSDCHGVHNIQPTRSGSPEEIKQNVVAACRKCHPDAGTNFPEAWLSHYDPSMDKAPLAYLVRTGYTIAIPLMIGGLLLHVAVDLWRIARNR